MRFIKKLRRVHRWGLALVALGAVAAVVTVWRPTSAVVTAQDEFEPPDPDTYVSSVEVTPGSTTLGATTTYSVELTFGTALPADAVVNLNFQDSSCERGFEPQSVRLQTENRCDFNLSSATSSTHDIDVSQDNSRSATVNFPSGQSAGTVTVQLAGVVNPDQAGAFVVAATSFVMGQEPGGFMQTSSSPFLMGTVIASGTVVDADGDPVPYVGVDLYDPTDWNPHLWANADANGFFAFVGDLPNGAYVLTAYPPQGQALAQGEPVSFTYSGSPVTGLEYQYEAATKTINVHVQYNTGEDVTEAQVNAWNQSGGGTGMDVDDDGDATLVISGGDWQVMAQQPWDQENNQQMSVDWIVPQPQNVSFANNDSVETRNLTITVQKATAVFEGRLVNPDGDPVANAWVDFRTGDGQGMSGGTDNDGEFSVNVVAGSYKVSVWTGENSDYFFEEQKASVKDGETKDLGDLALSGYDASISGTVTDVEGNPVEGVRIQGWIMNGFGWSQATTNAQGEYVMNAFEGQWQVNIESRDSGYVYSGSPLSASVDEGEDVTGLDFEGLLVADATLIVQLVAEDGGSVQNIFGGIGCREEGAGFKDFGGGIHGGFDRGIAQLPMVGGLTYVCDLWLPSEVGYATDGQLTVEVPEGETVTEEATLYVLNATIEGFLKDEKGRVIRDVEAEIWAADENFRSFRNTQLNSDGTFSLDVLDGTYNLGYWFPERVGEESEYIQIHKEDRVEVAEDETVSKVLVAPKRNATVTGRLLDPDGNQVDGFAWVGASNRRFLEDRLKADAEGAISMDVGSEAFDGEIDLGLVAGTHPVTGEQTEWDIFVGLPPEMQSLGWMSPQEVTITPEEGDEVEMDLQFSESDTQLAGTVVTEDGSVPEFGFAWGWNEGGQFTGVEIRGGSFSLPLTISDEPWHIGVHAEVFGEGYFESDEVEVTVSSEAPLSQEFTVMEYQYDVPEASSFSFDAGTAFSTELDDGTRLQVPAGAMGEEGDTFTITATPEIDYKNTNNDQVAQGFVYNFEATKSDGTLVEEFNQNVTLTIPFDDDVLALDGLEDDDIAGEYWDESTNQWTSADTATVDTQGNSVTLQLSHFTQVGIVGTAGEGTSNTSVDVGEKSFIASGYDNSGGPRIAKYTKDGALLSTWNAYNSALKMGTRTLVGDGDGDGTDEVWTLPGSGYVKHVRRFDAAGQVLSQFFTYAGYKGEVEAELYDVDGDGQEELVMVPADDAPAHVTVWDQNGVLLSQFTAYEGYRGGVVMSVNDLDGDGDGEIVLATNDGHNHVTVWDRDGNLLTTWNAFPSNTTGGVSTVETADMDGDGTVEVLVSAQMNTEMVRTFDKDGMLLTQMEISVDGTTGTRFWTLDSNGDGEREVLTVKAHSELGATETPTVNKYSKDGDRESVFSLWPQTIERKPDYNVWLAITDSDGDGDQDIVTTAGQGNEPMVRIVDARTGTVLTQWDALNPGYQGGVMLTPIVD